MRRKVIKLAKNTLVVSLPAKWAKRHNVEKGNEVEIEEIGNSLKLRAETSATEGRMTVKVPRKEDFLRRIIDTPYRMGYDEVRIEYDDPELYHKIQSEINNLMGFEIIHQGDGYCVARNIAQGMESEFETSLNRLFLVTIQFAEDLKIHLEKKEYDKLEVTARTEDITNRLAHFCKRMLNLERTPDPIRSRSTYRIVSLLEETGDLLRKASVYMKKEENYPKKTVILYIGQVIDQFRMLLKLYRKRRPDEITRYGRIEKKNERHALNLIKEHPKQAYIITLFAMMVENIKHMSEEIL
jgi:phosphate uptake regulator